MGLPRVYGVSASPFVRKVRAVLLEKGIEYELEPVMPGAAPDDEFLKMSPLGKIPCYRDDRVTLPDSSVICAYLERLEPEPALYPAEPAAFGRALWYEEYGDTRVEETVLPIFHERFIRSRVYREQGDEALVQRQLRDVLPSVFEYLEAELSGPDAAPEGIVAGRFSIADIALCSPLVNLEHSGEGIDAARWPHVAAWYAHTCARPSLRALIAEEKASFAAIA